MTSEEIIRRVAEQSFLLCFSVEVRDAKGVVIEPAKRITRTMLRDAVNDVLGEK